jgi:hypothetical protein
MCATCGNVPAASPCEDLVRSVFAFPTCQSCRQCRFRHVRRAGKFARRQSVPNMGISLATRHALHLDAPSSYVQRPNKTILQNLDLPLIAG